MIHVKVALSQAEAPRVHQLEPLHYRLEVHVREYVALQVHAGRHLHDMCSIPSHRH